jgi:hypothetical protein
MFVPGALNYAGINASITNQNFLMVGTTAPILAGGLSGTNLFFNWSGIPGVTYQAEVSTNLVDWNSLGSPQIGTNGLIQLFVPTSDEPKQFLRVRAAN